MCEGRLYVQVKNRIKTSLWALVEDWSSADAALEGIKRWCCYCRDRQGVPEAHCGGEERVLVGVHGAVWYQESDPMSSVPGRFARELFPVFPILIFLKLGTSE